MFDVTTVQNGLVGLVGIRQPYNPLYQKIDAENLASRSGRYLDDIPHYKTELFIDTQDFKDITDADLNNHLRDIQKASISTVCSQVFGNDVYIDRNYIFTNATKRTEVETTLQNGFVGFEIELAPTKNVAFKITDIRLEFEGTGTLKVLLFNSNKNAPLFTKDVTITSNDQIESLDWVVNSTNGDYKGKYYLGYIYDGTLVPYKRNYEAANLMNSISELCIEEVYVTGANDVSIFDLSSVYGLSENTGLNPDITVYEDYTDLILQNEHLFAHAIQLSWSINVMMRYATSIRSNRNERISKDIIFMTLQAIEGSAFNAPVKITGLNTILANEIIRLQSVVKDLKRGYFGGALKTSTMY